MSVKEAVAIMRAYIVTTLRREDLSPLARRTGP